MPRPRTPGSVVDHVPPNVVGKEPDHRPSTTHYERFLLWERSSRDTLEVKRTYIDMAGDLVAGIILSQIVYWHLPDREGNTRLRVSREGKLWLAKARTEWWDECRVTPKQVDRAMEALRHSGVIETRLFKFNGAPTVHIRLNETRFMELWEAQIDGQVHALRGTDFPLKGESIFPSGGNPCSLAGEVHLPRKARSLTETTAKTTTETTTTVTFAPQSPDDTEVVALVCSLTDNGISRKRAEQLVAKYAHETIRTQIAALGYRKADDPAAVLIRAIEEDWALPAEYRKAQAQQERSLRQRLRREEQARQESQQTFASLALKTRQDVWWGSLDPTEKEHLLSETEKRLRQNSSFLFARGAPKTDGSLYRSLFDDERRRLIDERMVGTVVTEG